MPGDHLCPWWLCYTFDNPLRRPFQDPERVVGPYVRPGMTVMEVGGGMGYFAIPMARLVGPRGRVISVDVQQRMLDGLLRRAERAGVADRITTHLCARDRIGLDGAYDFVLTMWMTHELPDVTAFAAEVHRGLAPHGRWLLAEPWFHVSKSVYDDIVADAIKAGFTVAEEPSVGLSRAALLRKRRP